MTTATDPNAAIDNPTLIGVTGATGRLGGRVARRLAAAGARQRLVVRDPGRAPDLPHATAAAAAYNDPEAVRSALTGVPVALMVSAPETADRVAQHATFVDAAAAAGVGHLVYISGYDAAPDSTFTLNRDHYATEQHIRASGMRFTFLRDNMYADFITVLVGPDGVISGPGGDGRIAPVTQDDIADAAVVILLAPTAHEGKTYSLTGPESLTLDQVAETLTAELGRPVRYHRETIEEAYAARASYGAPAWQVDAWVTSFTAIANGELATVTDDIARLTGHPATRLADLLRQADFRPY